MCKQFEFGGTEAITIVVIAFVGLLGLSTIYAASGSGLIAPRVNIEATAQALQVQHRKEQLETASRNRMATIQTQIDNPQQSLALLESTVQTQTAQQHSQLTGLKQRAVQMQATIRSHESSIMQLEQAMQQDEVNHVRAMATLQAEVGLVEIGLRDQLATVTHQLQTAQAQLTPTPDTDGDDGKDDDDRDDGSTDDHDPDIDVDLDDNKDDDKDDDQAEDKDEDKHEEEDNDNSDD